MSSAEAGLRLGILAIEGCMLSSIASASDGLRVARRLAEIRHPDRPLALETCVFGARGQNRVVTSGELELGGLLPEPPERLDCVVLPGIMHDSPGDLVRKVAALEPEIELLRRLRRRAVTLAGSCSGAFVLAEAGLLEGRRATCSWWLSAAFRQRYPGVRLEADAMLVEDGGLMTTGGASAVLTLLLRLIERAGGAELAQQTARMLLIDPQRQSQAPYISRVLIEQPRDSMLEKAERYLQRSLDGEISVARLAEHCGTSERSLLRHFRSHYGLTPQGYVQKLRVERAKALLETSQLSFEEIVERCGYNDAASFRKLFKRATALTPGDYRERYRLRPH